MARSAALTDPCSIEERIDTALRNKQRLFDEVVDGVSLDLTAALDADELYGLFGLAAPLRHDGG